MDLVQWLRVQLDEDERIARAATPGQWWYNPAKQWLGPDAFEKYDLRQGEEFVGYGSPHPFTGAVAATGPANNAQSMRDAEFIAAHDPARVLREIRAKRVMTNVIAPAQAAALDAEHGCCHEGEAILAGECPNFPPNDLPLLRLLALPYADRPGYLDAWRP